MNRNDRELGTATTGPDEVLTFEKLQEAIDLIKNIPPDPVKALMLERGFDPDKGDIMLWPSSHGFVFGDLGPPFYVRLSGFISEPFVVKNPRSILGI